LKDTISLSAEPASRQFLKPGIEVILPTTVP